jgi:hypothetical protein
VEVCRIDRTEEGMTHDNQGVSARTVTKRLRATTCRREQERIGDLTFPEIYLRHSCPIALSFRDTRIIAAD